MAEDRPGFLGRWARRKTDVLQGKLLDEPTQPPVPVSKAPVAAGPASSAPVNTNADAEEVPTPEALVPEKLLSLDDVTLLTQESDFRPFMARNVGADVRNAAMKKLFTDPHYNVMDGLDIYISDYSIADPIPESMLRQMVGAKLLKIFDDEDDEDHKDDRVDEADKVAENAVLPAEPGTAGLGSPENLGVDAAGRNPTRSASSFEKQPMHAAIPELNATRAAVVPSPQQKAEPPEKLLQEAAQIAPSQPHAVR